MTFVVPSIVEELMNKIALSISVSADDWTAERAIIASNEQILRSCRLDVMFLDLPYPV